MSDTHETLDAFWSALESSPFLMLGLPAQVAHSQPMTAQFDSHSGPIWFYTTRSNRLVEGLTSTSDAMAQYVGEDHKLFACISGTLTVDTDPSIVDRFWTDMVDAWYSGGKADPDLVMLRFDLAHAEIWQADMSLVGQLKMIFGGEVARDDLAGKHVETAL
ncbi:pyridoxamine 5'-phosphate oxidase family protein [Blastomonas sp.]|uniref:pyridoxamine 5'-phosphate oxidase family protein n=1 Tax=Blastomonas sp. TaxID=1909299 RepID=UPI003594900A